MVTLVNRAKMATSTTGTGTITLGSAVTGFQTFADAGITNGMTVRYVIENGDNFEIGSGTYTASGTTLSRSVSESSNSDSALNLSGSSEVFLTAIAADIDAKLDKSGGTMTGVLAMGSNAITTSSTVDGRDLSADGTKLDGIEASATADQTAAEIRALVESASDSNVFTDADHSKLNGIEASATADQTDAEIRAAVEAASDSNVFTDADHSKLNAIEASADVTDATNVTAAGALMDSEVTNLSEVKAFDASDYATAAQGTLATNALPKSGGAMTGAITTNSTFDGRDVATDGTKLDGIESNATADQSNAEIRAAVEAASDSNVFTDADHTKLNGIEASATADQSNAEIRAAVEAASDSNVFTDADHTKLNAIEASADVTDTANVVAALSAGTGVAISGGGEITVTAVALTTVQTASSQSAHLALTTQEGDVVVRSDENKSYMRNSGTDGSMSDFTLLATPTDAVLSVNGNTGAITAAQIATAVEAASGSNTFTDADHSKLDAIEASADVTDATNVTAAGALMDSEVTNLSEVKAFDSSDYATAAQGTLASNALPKGGGAMTGAITTNSTFDGRDVATDGTKLDTIETNATADQTAAEVRALVESASDSNVFTDADHTKLNGIEASATADQSNAEIRAAVEAASDSNVFTDSDHSKLNGIEASADVTDTANVTSAGALMDSECASLADVKALNQSLVTSATPTFARLKLTQTTVAANSSATTLNFASANNFLVNMSADTTFTWSNLSGAIGCSGNIVLVQDATGGRDFTLPSEAKKPIDGATIVQNTGANEISVLSYYVMSSSQVLVNYIGDFA
tara:strand:- start:13215 stop:15653 length:2439 start_codon:yes stop_codon:yes gene_type:complete